MTPSCHTYRSLWLERALDGRLGSEPWRDHSLVCEECRAWSGVTHAQVAVLAALPRLEAPRALEERLLASPEARPGGGSPGAAEHPTTRALRELVRHRPPGVLDRLVAEELADPEAARVRRFAGDMNRKPVPSALDGRIVRLLRGGMRWRRIGPALATLAAAAAVLWIGLRVTLPAGPPERSFRVIRLESADGIDPMAASLLGGLTAGALDVAEGRGR